MQKTCERNAETLQQIKMSDTNQQASPANADNNPTSSADGGTKDTVFQISGYNVSRDYERLSDEMQNRSIICVVDYGKDCRDVARTIWSPSADGDGVWQLSARGITYIYAFSRAEFIIQCARYNVDVVMPNKEH